MCGIAGKLSFSGSEVSSPLGPLVHETLLADDSYVQRRYSAPLVHRLAAEHMTGARDHQRRLYSLLNLELWERELIRRAP